MLAEDAVAPATQAITFVLIGGLFSLVTLLVTNRSKRKAERDRRDEKEADRAADIAKEQRDYARQDALQARLDEAAAVQLAKLREIEETGKVSHALINANYTASLEAQRVALIGQLTSKESEAAMREQAGHPSPPETLTAILGLQRQITVLEASIADRLDQQHLAEQQVAVAKLEVMPPPAGPAATQPVPPPEGP